MDSHPQEVKDRQIYFSTYPQGRPRSDAKLFRFTVEHQGRSFRFASVRPHPDDLVSSVNISYLPRGLIKPAICAIQAQLEPGELLAIELIGLAPTVTFLSDAFMTCAVPFLRARPNEKGPAGGKGFWPSVTPLFVSLPEIVDLLTSGVHPLNVESVQNVSSILAEQLHSASDDFEGDAQLRTAIINESGMEYWRWLRLMTDWTAALLTAGKLMTWTIIVRKPA